METQHTETDRLFAEFRRRGDPRALGQVYDRLAPELLRLALHTTRDPGVAEDVLQATFLVAIERSGLGLSSMLEAYRTKFSIQDSGHVLMSLTWFEDAEADPDPILESEQDWESVKGAIRSWIKGL